MKLGKNDKITFDLCQDAFEKLKLAHAWEKERGTGWLHDPLGKAIRALEDSGYLDTECYAESDDKDHEYYKYWSARDDKDYNFEEFLKKYKENS